MIARRRQAAGAMRMAYNPTRRNRNIGTPKQGHGQNNRLVVPRLWIADQWPTAHLDPSQWVRRNVNGRDVTFIVEKTSGGCVHACTVEDVVTILSHVPVSDWDGLETFVFRQPTRKQRILWPAWGRMYYYADLSFRGSSIVKSGPAVFLEAMAPNAVFKWSTALDPDDTAELDRLRLDGHEIERAGRKHVISSSPQSVRATQLYRTLPHEIGHWFDWLENVERRRGEEDYSALVDRYDARSKDEKEVFAHRYAANLREALEKNRVIPFSRIEG
jgi:hypothetical protein